MSSGSEKTPDPTMALTPMQTVSNSVRRRFGKRVEITTGSGAAAVIARDGPRWLGRRSTQFCDGRGPGRVAAAARRVGTHRADASVLAAPLLPGTAPQVPAQRRRQPALSRWQT